MYRGRERGYANSVNSSVSIVRQEVNCYFAIDIKEKTQERGEVD